MLLKRIYNRNAPKEKWVSTKKICPNCKGKGMVVNEAVTALEKCDSCEGGIQTSMLPPVDYIRIEHTGTKAKQNFSTRMVEVGVLEGWITLENGTIKLHVKPETLVYRIDKRPGRYCSHCNEKLHDDPTGSMARTHVAINHLRKKSPDPESPGGYAQVNAYLCTLEEKQHEKYRAGRDR